MGVSSAQLEQVKNITKLLNTDALMTMIPGTLLIVAFISAFINYKVTKAIVKKLGYKMKDFTAFELIYIDNRIGALIIILVCLGIILVAKNYSMGSYIYNSSMMVLQLAFLTDGVAVATYFLKNRFKISKFLIIIIIVFTLFSQMSMIFIYIGLSDMIFDFRKVDPNRIFNRKKDKV